NNWFINFKITGENNRSIQPGQRILKRMQYGKHAELYSFALAAIKYFNGLLPEIPDDTPNIEKKKPWWKF
ncbi:MAG: hypothetical protein ABUT20_41350, partial [Bacteroidota bacterium]